MSRTFLAAGLALAVTALPQGPVLANDGSAITVRAPAIRGSGEPVNGVNQRMKAVTNVAVDYSDLDLRTEYGRSMLDRRMRLAADVACDRLDDIDPPSGAGAAMTADFGDCRAMAVRSAQPQMQRAMFLRG